MAVKDCLGDQGSIYGNSWMVCHDFVPFHAFVQQIHFTFLDTMCISLDLYYITYGIANGNDAIS